MLSFPFHFQPMETLKMKKLWLDEQRLLSMLGLYLLGCCFTKNQYYCPLIRCPPITNLVFICFLFESVQTRGRQRFWPRGRN